MRDLRAFREFSRLSTVPLQKTRTLPASHLPSIPGDVPDRSVYADPLFSCFYFRPATLMAKFPAGSCDGEAPVSHRGSKKQV